MMNGSSAEPSPGHPSFPAVSVKFASPIITIGSYGDPATIRFLIAGFDTLTVDELAKVATSAAGVKLHSIRTSPRHAAIQ